MRTLAFSGSPAAEASRPRNHAVQHLSILLFILVGAFGWGYYLDRFDLLYSTTGVVYGVGYTAGHVTLARPLGDDRRVGGGMHTSRIQFFRPRWKAMGIGIVSYGALYIIGIMSDSRSLSEVCRTAERIEPRNAVFEKLYRIHSKSIQAGRHPGNGISCAWPI